MTQKNLPNIEKNQPILGQMGRSGFDHQIKNHTRKVLFLPNTADTYQSLVNIFVSFTLTSYQTI